MSRLARSTARIVLGALALMLIMVTAVVVAVNVSPKPFAWYVQRAFSSGIGVEPVIPPIYDELRRRTRIERDIEYPSLFENNRLDVFSPLDAAGPTPTIIWVHGGGFVGGDKAGIETWATMIAAYGYTVVSIDYALAPENRYPTPIVQLTEVYRFLQGESERFPTIDLHRLIFGGDSAGAQIASQFVALQTNGDLQVSMRLDGVVPEEDLLAAVLYCGPYDFARLYDSESRTSRFLIRQIGWAYFGTRRWGETAQAAQASTMDNVTAAFPPLFVTDGNSGSFEPDARKLVTRVGESGVYVDSLFYAAEHGPIGHEYQFDFSAPESMEAFERTLAFLRRVTEAGGVT